MDSSKQRYCDRAFYFTGQRDQWRNDQVFRIDDILSTGVVEPLLD
jgi:hypothetical protein